MDNQVKGIKIFSFKKIIIAFFIGATIDFLRRFIEPAYGMIDFIFYFIYCWFYSIVFTGLVVIIGFLFFIPQLKKIWFENNLPFRIIIFSGSILFIFGIWTAHYVYFNLYTSGDEADIYLNYFARPGYILILFALCFWPSRQKNNG